MVSVALLSSPALHRQVKSPKEPTQRLRVSVRSPSVPSRDLRQDAPIPAPGEGVMGTDGGELTPQAQTLRVSAHSLSLDGLQHLCFCRWR